MKKLYSDEVANELDYQKYWPEKSDWAKAIFGFLLSAGLFFAVFLYAFNVTGYTARKESEFQEHINAVSTWCNMHPEKNLAETKECLSILAESKK